MKLTHLPNLLTLARLLSVPVTVWLIAEDRMAAAFWLYLAAGATDAIDGAVARLFNARTVLGAYLDPLADKALLVSIYVMLGWLGHLDSWLVIMIVFRDLLIVGGALLMLMITESSRVKPLFISKTNTFMQILLAALVLANLGLGVEVADPIAALTWIVAATTLGSGLAYMVSWWRRIVNATGAGRGGA